MSNRNKPRLSLRGDQNELTTEPTEQVQAAINEPTQEKNMEAVQEKTAAPSEPTAKQMAEVEALNAERARKQIEIANAKAAPAEEPVSIVDLAARGYDALHEAFRKHNEHKPPEYVAPPRTVRQMTALQEELEAGRKTQQRAEAQKLASLPPPVDAAKEGFTVPVYRPNDVVPDPILPAGASAAGNRQFGVDAP